jgi:hypothetical protein
VDGGTVYGPAGIGGHRDHLLVRSLLEPLRREGADVRLYADLPYCARHGWPGWVTGAEGRPEADDQWARALEGLDLPALTPRAVRLDADAQERKRDALAGYRTQLEALTTDGARHVTDPDVLPFEAYWEPGGGAPAIDAASRS